MLNETSNILARLAVADRAHQKESGGRLLLRSVKYAGAMILSVFILDVVFHLNAGWRLGLLLGLLAGLIALLAAGWHCAFVRRNRLEHIARFLEARDPALGSRLINLLQLRGQTGDESLAPLTRELARQAVEKYAAELRDAPLESLARTDELPRQLRRAAWALFGLVAVLALGFHITAVELVRFADPFGDHPPYSFTHLEITQPGPAGTNVLYGRGFVVRARASGHAPKEVFLTAFPPGHPEQAVTVPMFDKGGRDFDQLLANLQDGLLAYAHTRDHVSESKRVRIGVVLTPQLDKAFVRVAPPAYTGLRPEEKNFAFKGVSALAGSEVGFRLQSNRPLREGWLELAAGDQPPQRIALKKSADHEVSGSFIAAESGRLRFSIVDVAGLASAGDFESALTVTHDLPPEVRLTNPGHDAFVALDFKLSAQIEASDDYGLREIRLQRGLNGVFSAPKIFTNAAVVLARRETVDFNFAGLGLRPGDVISLFAEAMDNAPEPHLARSQLVRLQVIGVEDYNNFLREKMDIADIGEKFAALNDDLQELIDQQQQLAAAAQQLKEQLASAPAGKREALAQSLDALIAKQGELNAKLNRQAERMENFVRSNPLYDVETDLADQLRQQAENIRNSTSINDTSVRRVAQRSSPATGPRRLSPELLADLKQAADDQAARLGGVHEAAEKDVVDKLADLGRMQELINDFNLFESLYRTQQDLAQQAQAYNRPGQLGREDQLALKELAATENEVAAALDQLQSKLRDDAAAAEKLFPKAARSGRSLADQIGENRLEPLARQATGRMLAADGGQSFVLADRLRGEMGKMFGECRGGNCPSGDELDSYLKLQRLNPGQNFAQMSRSRKFSLGSGRGRASGQGEGAGGTSGYAVMDGSALDVMGNETSIRNGGKTSRQSSRFGKGAGAAAGDRRGEVGKPDVLKGLNPVNRQSGAVSSETVIEEYNDVVENYFRALTTRKEPLADEKTK